MNNKYTGVKRKSRPESTVEHREEQEKPVIGGEVEAEREQLDQLEVEPKHKEQEEEEETDNGGEVEEEETDNEAEEDEEEAEEDEKESDEESSSVNLSSEQITSMDNFEMELDISWRILLNDEFEKLYFKKLKRFLATEIAIHGENDILPPKQEIFNAFNHCTPDKVNVVIMGQDPYQVPGLAHGFAFSVKPGVVVPSLLINIYKELGSDIKGFERPNHGTLTKWADQGVLLLNTVLTVRKNVANSHQQKGWEQFTDATINLLNKEKSGLVFIMWGKFVEAKAKLIDKEKHLVLESTHPSPFSAYKGFFGCKHFSKCNEYLKRNGQDEIDWQV